MVVVNHPMYRSPYSRGTRDMRSLMRVVRRSRLLKRFEVMNEQSNVRITIHSWFHDLLIIASSQSESFDLGIQSRILDFFIEFYFSSEQH